MKRILIVDDEEQCRTLLLEVLALYGYEVEIASNGEEALKLMEGTDYYIIITDYNMPGLSGTELVKIIKGMNKDSFIVGISADDVGEKFVSAGASFFMKKPININELIKLVENYTKGKD
jgi:DNA-binding NtrC family response regulator